MVSLFDQVGIIKKERTREKGKKKTYFVLFKPVSATKNLVKDF